MRKLGTLLVSCAVLASMTVPAGAFLGSPGRQIVNELPDPNVPLAPEVVTVNDAGEPRIYVRTENPNPSSEEDEYVYIPEDEIPLDEATPEEEDRLSVAGIDDGGDDDDSSADGFGGWTGPEIDPKSAADEMSTDSSGGFPVVPVAGTVGGVAVLGFLLFGLKAATIPGVGSAAATKVSLFTKLVHMLKHKR